MQIVSYKKNIQLCHKYWRKLCDNHLMHTKLMDSKLFKYIYKIRITFHFLNSFNTEYQAMFPSNIIILKEEIIVQI